MSDSVDRQPFIDKLGEVKDATGEWHDCEELVAIATEILEHGSNCKLLRELKRIRRFKLESARSVAEDMRQKYLSSPIQKQAQTQTKVRTTRSIGHFCGRKLRSQSRNSRTNSRRLRGSS